MKYKSTCKRLIFFLSVSLFFSPFTSYSQTISTHYEHSLSICLDGTARSWGYNHYGQLGDSTNIDRHTPVQVSALKNVVAIIGGSDHTLAIKLDSTMCSWGANSYGELGDGTTIQRNTPVQVSGLSSVIAAAAGGWQNLALKSGGSVWAWGSNLYGQLGDGTQTNRLNPFQISGLNNVIAVACGGDHSLALKSDGKVWGWGNNIMGELGDGTDTNRYFPVQVLDLTNVVAIAGGWTHSLAIKSDSTVWAMGYNFYGQLGDSTNIDRHIPVQVSELIGVVAIAGGWGHSLALKSDGTVWAWGDNEYGELGDSTVIQRNIPVQVIGLTNVITIAGGFYYSLALKSDGTVWAWGRNNWGQLGDGSTTDRHFPVQVSNICSVLVEGALPVSNFESSDTILCANNCANFTDKSTNAISWRWSFQGATPSSSTDENPQNICYQTDGNYDVTLIASNAGGFDSVTFSNYINVTPAPSAPVIAQVHDTLLYCSTDPSYTSYQWYSDTTLILGATDTVFVINRGGNYNVQVTNGYGCKIAVGINIVLGILNYTNGSGISIYPNPATNQLTIHTSSFRNEAVTVSVMNLLGQEVSPQATLQWRGENAILNIGNLAAGIYFVQVANEHDRWIGKFVKE